MIHFSQIGSFVTSERNVLFAELTKPGDILYSCLWSVSLLGIAKLYHMQGNSTKYFVECGILKTALA